jgi:putrescine transport system substrate-binding protein
LLEAHVERPVMTRLLDVVRATWRRPASPIIWLALAVLLAVLPRSASAQNELKILNWSDYINPAVLDAFTRETGIRVIYDTYDQKEQAEAALRSGKSGYDLVVIDALALSRHIALKLYAPLDKTLLANLSHLLPDITRRLARHDPENRHAVNYLWGTTGLGYNLKKIRERLGPEAKVESWSILFNPEILKKLAPCGVHVLDAPEELFPAALRYLGLDPDSRKEADWRRATELLLKIRPYIQKFHSAEFISGLANGDICLAVGSSGDVMQARRRARDSRNDVEIGFAIPKEGALVRQLCHSGKCREQRGRAPVSRFSEPAGNRGIECRFPPGCIAKSRGTDLSAGGHAQPFRHLSAGRCALAALHGCAA